MAGFIQSLLSHSNKIFSLFFFLISLFLFHITCLQAHLLCPQEQSSALLLFKSQFSFNKSASSLCEENEVPSHPRLESWKEGTDCCSWDGVECDTETSQVVGLDLSCSWLQLKGTIHPNNTLFHHHFPPHLQRLNLAFNDFNHSRIPSAFTQLTQLTHLNLSFSEFSGQVPIEFSFLNKLVSLDLSFNDDLRLQGSGFELLVQNLTKIRELHLGQVNISTVLPNSLLNLTTLAYLDFADCGFHGKFLPGIFQLPHLKGLELSGNMDLIGYFPKFMNSSSPLQHLELSVTSFFGELPDAIGNLKSLEVLYVNDCQFCGSIPMSFGNLTKITSLDLSSNNFTGMLPSSFSNLINLNYLELPKNHFHGKIADVLPSSKILSYLSLSSNNFSGPFPFENLTGLVYVSAMDNRFIGPLPMQIIGLPVLKDIYLGDNLINGSIPSWIFSLPSLEYLDLSYNKFTGFVKVFLSSSLLAIYLDNNNLHGTIPSSLCNAIFLKILRLSNNKLSGSIPQCLGNLRQNLFVLDLSSNNLTGAIPHSLGNLSQSLFILDLSNNSLSGTIPRNFGILTQNLTTLNLQMNKFFGTIPDTFANGSQLNTINFNENRLEGTIPKSLVNCRLLKVLDLGSNRFVDEFPHWIDNLPSLHVLILRSNKFHGPILTSKTRFPFPKLRVLDMSNNSFTGPLPRKYIEDFEAFRNVNESNSSLEYVTMSGNFSKEYYSLTMVIKGLTIEMKRVLTYFAAIDLSQNKFQGEIPETIGRLISVRGLNLSHNRFSGHIPASLENLTTLEWLDLSSNKLTGRIPRSLTNLGFLQVLNLSRNQLTGPIPQGKQFDTFSNDSYIDNLALCGPPLSNACSNTKTPEPPSSISEDSQSSSGFFNWEVILPGYGCGLVFGISMGYIMFSTGKPQWFVRIVEREEIKSRKRPKKVARRHRGRRN